MLVWHKAAILRAGRDILGAISEQHLYRQHRPEKDISDLKDRQRPTINTSVMGVRSSSRPLNVLCTATFTHPDIQPAFDV